MTIRLTSGRSQELAERILKGDTCDVFAPSSPAVIEQDLMAKKVATSGKVAASWFVIFSANEMVVITAKGNPLGIKRVADLATPSVKFVRVTGEKDLATNRSIDFLKKAAALEGAPEVAQRIIGGAVVDPSRPTTVPDTIRAIREGKANAGVVYYSAAVAAKNDLDRKAAIDFINLLLSAEGQMILEETGQPAVVPAIRKGDVPAELR